MSEPSPGPGWWLASDGKWYPPKQSEEPPAPGWWLASDGRWYPPKESEEPPAPGWWLASDGKWYPPERAGDARRPAEPDASAAVTPTKGRVGRFGRSKGRGARRSRRRDAAHDAEPAVRAEPAPGGGPATVGARDTSTELAGAMTTVPAPDFVRPNPNEGVSPFEQIERRDQASRADARVLAAARAAAAARALSAMQTELDRPVAVGRRDEATATVQSELARATEPPPRQGAEAPSMQTDLARATERPPRPDVEIPDLFAPEPSPPAPPTSSTAPASTGPRVVPPHAPRSGEPDAGAPLLEVKSSPLSADLEHIGDRLAIFPDRVELRDRLDRVRHTIHRDDIVDVTVTKKLTGAMLSVHSAKGAGIVAKGLRADQADEARALIQDGGAASRPSPAPAPPDATTASRPSGSDATAGPPTQPPPATRPRLDQADLVGKLRDLRRAGVLTEDEYQQKVELVARLVRLEELAPTRG